MTLKDPRAYRSREFIWMDKFRRRRVAELSPHVTEALLAELSDDPKGSRGDHSDELSQVINFVRNEAPMAGRAFVYVEEPNRSYRLARMRGRGKAPDLDGPSFASEAEAVAAVIIERLEVLGLLTRAEAGQ